MLCYVMGYLLKDMLELTVRRLHLLEIFEQYLYEFTIKTNYVQNYTCNYTIYLDLKKCLYS